MVKIPNKIKKYIKKPFGRTKSESSLSTIYPDDTFIVSYPRSGNSFLQHLIYNYLHPDESGSPRSIILDIHENPGQASEVERPRIIKSHEEEPRSYPNVIYVARDGRDVAISYHAFLQRSGHLSENTSLGEFLDDFAAGDVPFGTWSNHVENWLDDRGDALVVRYEDMLEDGEKQLRRVLEFMDRTINAERVSKAVQASQFDELQKKEKGKKRGNKVSNKELFFRKGQKKQWKSEFTDDMNSDFVEHNSNALRRLGYIDD